MSGGSNDTSHARIRRLAVRIQHELVQGPLREEWGNSAATVLAELQATPVRRLLDVERVRAALHASLSEPAVERATQPILRHVMTLVMARLAARREPLTEFVPERARQQLDELVAHPDIVPASIVREVMTDPAVESVLRDVLFEALRQFSENVSPFTAEWGLPALLKRLPPIGAGPIKTAIKTMRADFDKRLEPEIRRFLAGFSKRAARRVTELSLRKQQEPEFVELRQRILSALLKRELGELVWPPDDRRGELLIDAVVSITGHVALHEVLRAELDQALDTAIETYGDRTVGEALAALGVALPDLTAMAEAYWPAAEQVLSSDTVRDHLERAITAALAEEEGVEAD